jgi:hypothetical protein
MMFTATALMKPVSTAFGTNLTTAPRRNSPAASIASPVRTPNVTSAAPASGPSRTSGTSAMITAIAPVPWTDIRTELVATAPATVPNRYP